MGFSFIPNKHVEVPDIPFKERVDLPARKTALIIVDMQNDFIKPNGTLVVEAASETVLNIQNLIKSAREAGVYVTYTQDTQIEDDPEFTIWPKHCIKNTWGWEIIDEIKPLDSDLISLKNRYDGFYGSWLDHFLSEVWDLEHVVIVGTVANICVLHTAASAGLRWFHVVIPANGISAMTEFDQALTLRQVSSLYNGEVVKSTMDIGFN